MRGIRETVAITIAAALGLLSCTSFGWAIVPSASGYLSVADYGAIPNDGIDDTAAIQAAINDRLANYPRYGSGGPFVYLPAGVYNVSDTLESRIGSGGFSDGWRAGLVLIGEDRDSTVLQLPDNASGFNSSSSPRAVLRTGSEGTNTNPNGDGNQAFRHLISNLTIDVGSQNPGAVGVDLLVSNRGGMENVTIRSPTGVGHTGVRMDRNWPGPGLVKDVAVDGFDVGVSTRRRQYSMTLSDITLTNQNVYGIQNSENTLAIENLHSTNTVPAIRNSPATIGQVTLINSVLEGGSPTESAISALGSVYLRDVVSDGYQQAIDNQWGNRRLPAQTASRVFIPEFTTEQAEKNFLSLAQSLRLPVKSTPTYYEGDLSKWANVVDFGAIPNSNTHDNLPAIQAAIDQAASLGHTVVYLPSGTYKVSDAIELRGSVRKLMGFNAGIIAKNTHDGPILRMADGEADAVVVEHVRLFDKDDNPGAVEHNSDRALSLRHVDIGAYTNTANGTGDAFFEDVIADSMTVGFGQSVWARQYNTEFGPGTPLIVNNGANLWFNGLKTESTGSNAFTKVVNNGGATEIHGAQFFPLTDGDDTQPLLINNGGSLSASFTVNGGDRYPILVQDTQNGETRNLRRAGSTGVDIFPNISAEQSRVLGLYATHADAPSSEVVVAYSFDASGGGPTDAATTVLTGAVASSFDAGPGYANSATIAEDTNRYADIGGSYRREALAYLVDDSASDAEAANAVGDYFELTVSSDPGKLLEVHALELVANRANGSPDTLSITTSVDGFQTVFEPWVPTNNLFFSSITYTFDLWYEEYSQLDEITIRVIGHGANTGGSRDTGRYFRLDDVTLLGRVIEAPLTGDFNNDGVVDIADYTVWRDTLGQHGYRLPADANRDGFVDDADYDLWTANFGSTASPIPLPEPGQLLVALVAAASSFGGGARRCRPASGSVASMRR